MQCIIRTAVPGKSANDRQAAWQDLLRTVSADLYMMNRHYGELQIRDALNRRSDYVQACKELALLLGAYNKVNKVIQAAMYDDVLVAFRKLPSLDSSKQLSAVNTLLQATQRALPKQRRRAAFSEYKHAAIAQSHRYKSPVQRIGDHVPLPHDVLIHIFGFLDAPGLAKARAVCRDWRAAATDDSLWRSLFLYLYVTSTFGKTVFLFRAAVPLPPRAKPTWLATFEACRQANPQSLLLSNRAYCLSCKAVIWVSESRETWSACSRQVSKHKPHIVKPLTPEELFKYTGFSNIPVRRRRSKSDSEDEEDEEEKGEGGSRHPSLRLWAIPRLLGNGILQ